MSTRWDPGARWESDRSPVRDALVAVGVVLLISGIGPVAVAQLVYWAVTGERLDP